MIVALAPEAGRLQPVDASDPAALARAVWIDVLNPTDEEKREVERHAGLYIATAAELQEIESSSRLSVEEDTLYLSMPLVEHVNRREVRSTALGFALTRDRLLSVRYAKSRLFDLVHERALKFSAAHQGGAHIFVTLLETIVDRLADDLEQIRDDLDGISRDIFRGDLGSGRAPRREDAALRSTLKAIGVSMDLVSRIRDSLLGVARIVPFTTQMAAEFLPADSKARFDTLRQDIGSLSGYDTHLVEKMQFLLDATLGFINIAQNNIMKTFTVFSVAGIPPVLIAGIYGMNFKIIPELQWTWGYPYSLALIALSGIVPLILFKWRGWL
jgi:magnesium transporter